MKIIYHSADFDGKCSAAILKIEYPEAELIGLDYGDIFPWEQMVPNEIVFMVDYSIQEMERLNGLVKLVWIDHHKTAIEQFDSSGFAGLRDTEFAACELVWKYLYPDKPIPRAIHYLGRYDIWDHSDPNTLIFQYGMRCSNPSAGDVEFWKKLFDPKDINIILEIGPVVKRYSEQSHEAMCKVSSFTIEWEGLKWVVINGPYRGSGVFLSVADDFDGTLAFHWTGKFWKFSLTSKTHDVSAIAKKYGGGHKGAAGFQSPSIPFNLG